MHILHRHKDDDEIVVSTQAASIHQSDLRTLERDEWVGDNVIAFHAEWLDSLQQETTKMFAPSVVELLCSLPETSTQELSQIVPVPTQRFLLLPVSDRYAETGRAHNGGGHHWSLVLLDAATGQGYHFDSLEGINRLAADRVYHMAAQLIGKQPAYRSAILVEELEPQANSSDCGIYCLLLTSLLHRALAHNSDFQHVIPAVCQYATAKRVSHFRQSYRDWLEHWGKRSRGEHEKAPKSVRSDFLELIPDLGSV